MHAFGVVHSVRKVKYLGWRKGIKLGSVFGKEGEDYALLVADLLNVEQATTCSDI